MAESAQKSDVMTSSDVPEVPEDDSDVILMVEGRPINAHRQILSVASPVFRAMFSHDFKERQETNIDLPDKKHDDVMELLRWIYPTSRRNLTDDAVYRLLPLVDEYQIEWLKVYCEEYLVQAIGQKENQGFSPAEFFLKHLYIADRHSLHKLSKLAIDLCKSIPTKTIEEAPSYNELDDHHRWMLMRLRAANLEEKQGRLSREIRSLTALVPSIMSIQTDISSRCPLCTASKFISHDAGLNSVEKRRPLACISCKSKYERVVEKVKSDLV